MDVPMYRLEVSFMGGDVELLFRREAPAWVWRLTVAAALAHVITAVALYMGERLPLMGTLAEEIGANTLGLQIWLTAGLHLAVWTLAASRAETLDVHVLFLTVFGALLSVLLIALAVLFTMIKILECFGPEAGEGPPESVD